MAECLVQPNHLKDVEEHALKGIHEEYLNVTVNGKKITVLPSTTIYDACAKAGERVPTMCHHPRLKPAGKCGVCVVEVRQPGRSPSFVLSCSVVCKDGMEILTKTQEVKGKSAAAIANIMDSRRKRNPADVCKDKELEDMVSDGIDFRKDNSSNAVVIDWTQCIQCTRCVRACRDLQAINIYSLDAGWSQPIKVQDGLELESSDCIGCGQCSLFCPTGAITEGPEIDKVLEQLAIPHNDPKRKVVIGQFAPSTRVTIAEEFGMASGTIATGKIVSALKRIGFDYVFDTNFGADLTIMEEGTELLNRITNGGPFPMFTSCCPGWVTMVEKLYPEYQKNLSTAKSPMQMLSAMIKTYFAQKINRKPEDIYVVALMPCTAKKYEISRPEMGRNNLPDTDCVLTTREMAEICRRTKIDFLGLPDAVPDSALGESTGAAILFGATGGVMEAALRTAIRIKTGKHLEKLEFNDIRGLDGIKECVIPLNLENKKELRIAVSNGGRNARELLSKLKSGSVYYDFIEIMACPGGCIGGGGQPRSRDPDVLKRRMGSVYTMDSVAKIRYSMDNPEIIELYKQFLHEPCGHVSHELLHTTYRDRSRHVIAAAPEAVHEIPAGAKPCLVLYGSQTGNTEAYAKRLCTMLCKSGFEGCRISAMDAYDYDLLIKEQIVILFTSTFRDGELPDNAMKFWSYLSDKPDDYLKNIQFAVFGLGASSYPLFNQAARLLDDRMEKLGSTRIVDRAEADQDSTGASGYDQLFKTWTEGLISQLGIESASTNIIAPKYIISIGYQPSKPAPPPTNTAFGRIIVNKLLTPADYDRRIIYLEIDIKGTGIKYKVGDCLGVLPRNPKPQTLEFIRTLGMNPDQVVSVSTVPGADVADFGTKSSLTIEELFVQYLDIFKSPARSMVGQLANFATDSNEQKTLLHWSEEAGEADYNKFITEHPNISIANLFEMFKSVRPSLDYLIELLPFIKGRLYSIASSPKKNPDVVELVVVVPMFVKRHSGRVSAGLCTDYLGSLVADDVIPIYNTLGTLTPPTQTEMPLVLCGLGTGIAPMRAFLQERKADKDAGKTVGEIVLFYGCRHKDKDFVLQDEWEMYKQAGVLSQVIPAFSHDQTYYVFVTHKIEEHPDITTRLIKKNKGAAVYCGPAMGIPQRIEESIKKAAMKVEGLSQLDADAFMFDVKTSGRWLAEAFGLSEK
jgi:NADH-quinone oxidoreductase subunit G